MKRLKFKVIAGLAFFVLFVMNFYGESTTNDTKAGAKKSAKVEKAEIPLEVTEVFYVEYPDVVYDEWYGYPEYGYGDYWYDDWYNPYVYTEFPEYYVVEFTENYVPEKVVYSKDGKKIGVHKSVSTIPKAVSEAISKGEYKTWKLDNENEEIFKDKDSDQLKVYKVTVEKGNEKHNLFYQANGKLLKDKKM